LPAAKDRHDEVAAKEAREEQAALTLFKSDMGAFVRLYTFLSQIFDYGNTAIEKRAIFYRQLVRVLDFGREREGIDLSKVVLTHHHLRNLGKRTLPLQVGEQPKLDPIKESGSGMAREPERAYMNEIIAKLNELFGEDTTDNDHLTYIDHVLVGKLKESEILRQQAANNSKEQFRASPDFRSGVVNAAMDAQEAHMSMSNKLLNSPEVLSTVLDILLKRGLWEALRDLPATAPGSR
jgi:type I restriction enzyme, R subunit